ncbi:MAG TPA: DUF3616 domain-containing protein [Allosphingosinicella sp.]|uniref:DUF3616 domain-containing protein n=1 Tax=Allosphingosinicella sp. TaxID=2823234 RepID=UPI002ED828A9
MFGSSKTGWPEPAKPHGDVSLRFDAEEDDDNVRNLSAATRIGNTLFVAGDECAAIERLTGEGDRWANHRQLPLGDYLDLADAEEEADLEGLAADDNWLWLVGSHARTRAKPEKEQDECIDLHKLADLKDTRPRCLLARLPLVETEDGWLPVRKDGKRRAGLLKQSKDGGALAKALSADPLLKPFTRVPAKEGGLDIEGIAVCGERVALGMRGPVIATHALLLELKVKAKASGKLELDGAPVKRLLAMEGLGIRDLKKCGDDLLILAGPTTGLSGPVALYRWRDWANDPPQDDRKVRLHRPERLLDLPFGRGEDHPEGLALWGEDGVTADQILVVCDSPGHGRFDARKKTLRADIFDLPE